jgi:hypothetical protein
VSVGGACAEIAGGFLFADPLEEWLKLRGGAERVDTRIDVGQLGIGEEGVELLVAGLAEGGAMLGLAAFLLGGEMVQGDQIRRHMALAEGTLRPVGFVGLE